MFNALDQFKGGNLGCKLIGNLFISLFLLVRRKELFSKLCVHLWLAEQCGVPESELIQWDFHAMEEELRERTVKKAEEHTQVATFACK